MELTGSLNHMLHRASQAGDQMFAVECQTIGLTARQYAVLQAIALNPGGTQAKIVTTTGVDRSTLSDLLTRLQAKRLISRERSFTDARSHIVHLTAEGEKTLEAARTAAARADQRLTDIVGETDARRLLDYLARISTHGQLGDATPAPPADMPTSS